MGELNSVIEWLVLARNEKCLPGEEAAFDKAIEILKANEPMKRVVSEEKYGDALDHCPSCERALPNSGVYGKSYYCYKCGQAVKW